MARKTTKTSSDSAAAATEENVNGPTVLPAPEVVKTLGKRELIDRVVEASGIKKKAAKPVVEAMLRELGDALSRGETLNLQPFGKGIIKSRKSLENADVIEMRLRRSKQAMAASADEEDGSGTDPLAQAAE